MIDISKTNLGAEGKRKLFFECGGLCSICCEPLDYDIFSRAHVNVSEYAHVIGDEPNGPRGNESTSKLYSGDINNIILLCPRCHTNVDKNTTHYTTERLHNIKSLHIERVRKVLNSIKNAEAFLVTYEARIGERVVKVDEDKMNEAVRESGFISHEIPISLNPNNTAYTDAVPKYWEYESGQLLKNFKDKIESRLVRGEMKPFLLFAIAPQPLLIRLGTLMDDKLDIRVFQKRREPDTWLWDDIPVEQHFEIKQPKTKNEIIVVKLSLSDRISDDRIVEVLGKNISIWEITHDQPNNDFIRHPSQLEALREVFRKFYRMIRKTHGQKTKIHVFPACPVSASVEFGRAWMPKVDADLLLYDQNKVNNRFEYAFMIEALN